MTLHQHLSVLNDRVRCGAYRRAIAESVRPGGVVLDLGTGTGLPAYFRPTDCHRVLIAVQALPPG